jgi:hypothetical protein
MKIGKLVLFVAWSLLGHRLFPSAFSREYELLWQYLFIYLKWALFLFCLQRKHLRFVSVFGKTLSRDNNNVVVFPFPFHFQIQRPLKPALISACCCMIMNHLEHHLLCASSRYRCCCFRHLRNVYWSFLTLNIAFRLVPTLLDCPAWGTMLVAVLSPTWFSLLREITSLFTMATGDSLQGNSAVLGNNRCLFWDPYKTHKLCGQNVEFVNIKPGTYSDHWALEGYI